MNNPTLTIIARVNGFRKTTLALDCFKNSQATFINADLIVIGISSNTPDLSQFRVVNLRTLANLLPQCV
jgi:predicted ABC-type ATPase